MDLSIVIASHNRSQSLLDFLQQLSHQEVPNGVNWEVLIIDNGSSDGTRAMVAPFIEKDPKRFRYLFEKRPCKSIALNAGIREAAGEVLVFTDDDCVPAPCWLASLAQEFSSDPTVAVVGGRVELFNDQHRPVSIRTSPHKTTISTIDDLFSLFIGCNMAIHRRVFSSIVNFDPLLGPGARVPAMEDLDFLYRAYQRNFKISYSPDSVVYHNHGRTTEREIQALNRNYVIGRGSFYCKHILRGDRNILKMAYWETLALSKALLKGLVRGRIDPSGRVLSALLLGAVRRILY
jgi:glycosyltransferase involved in cell wall biosynthesis